MNEPPKPPNPNAPDIFTAYGSNAFRLSVRHWALVFVLSIFFIAAAPRLWQRAEKLDIGPDFRMNYDLGNDYGLYERCAERVCAQCDTVLVGDSVVWGEYVTPAQTLSHHLNALLGAERVGNLGLDGAHPLALAGLMENYGGAIAHKNVILFCNPLWMSSPKSDLQITDETRFNHPKLVPQFSPWIPCYKEDIATRLGNVVDRNSSFRSWTAHVQMTCFDKSDIPDWTIENPYKNPLAQLRFELPKQSDALRHKAVAWSEGGIQKQDFPFVALKTSLQWGGFRRTLDILKSRGNKVHVVIVPLNEYMMTDASRNAYETMRAEMAGELAQPISGADIFSAPLLPSELYADASHPLNDGYRLLAKQIFEKFFK